MSIRPVDIQVIVPKTAEVAKQSQIELQKQNLDQQMFSNEFRKQVEIKGQQVIQSNKTEKKAINKDEKGNTGGGASKRNKGKSKDKDGKESGKSSNSTSMFDIRI